MISILLCCALLSANADFAPRVATLETHVLRLETITVPPELDGEKTAKLNLLRESLAAGVENDEEFNQLYRQIDEVRMWLWEHAVDKPALPPGGFHDSERTCSIETGGLSLRLNKEFMSMRVKTPAKSWWFEPGDEKDVVFRDTAFSLTSAGTKVFEPFNTGYSVGMAMTLSDFPAMPGFVLRIVYSIVGNELVVEMNATDVNQDFVALYWPKSPKMEATPYAAAVIPRMQGILIPGDWPQQIDGEDLTNSRTLYMPWWGVLESASQEGRFLGAEAHGMQTILETTDDAGVVYHHPAGGPTTIAPKWYASLGQMRYPRVVRYVFEDDHASYVTQAKRFRRYVRETGSFVSLDEKRTRTPALNEVIGRPVIHIGALYHFVPESALFNKERIEANHSLSTFDELASGLERLKERGVDDAYIHLDGWGYYGYDNGHPDVMPVGQEQGGWDGLRRFADTCDELGYLFAVHDQYRDFYKNAVSFDYGLTITHLDGTRDEGSTWCGGPQAILNPRFAPGYVRRNHDQFAAHDVKVKGAYLDVFSVVPLEESALPLHPLTRTDCARYRRECFDLLRARGYVVSSEEPTDYLTRSLDLVHHAPYPVRGENGEGTAIGVPVPLFNLVYHDSILTPWSMTEDGGWGIPDGDAGRLHCMLNAGLPYLGMSPTDEQLTQVRAALELAQQCGTTEMMSHQFLENGWRTQRTTFSNGYTVTVHFDDKRYAVALAQ